MSRPAVRPHRHAARSSLGRVVVGATLACALISGAGGRVLAQSPATSPAAQPATSLSIVFEPAKGHGLPDYLVATLTRADGSAVPGRSVRFRRRVDVFGGRTVDLAQAVTDNAGKARVVVVPREHAYTITASFAGTADLSPTETTSDITFPDALVEDPQHVPRSGLVDPQLQPIGDAMPMVLGAGVLAVWIVLLAVLIVAVWAVRAAGRRDASGSGTTATQTNETGPPAH